MAENEHTTMKLKDACESIFSGGTPNTSTPGYWSGEYYWLSSGETRNRFIKNTEKTITEAGIENSSTRLAKFGAVLVASAGQGKTRGQTSFALIDTYINQSIIALRANETKLYPLYLFYFLSGRYDALRNMSDANAIRGSLTCKMFENMEITIPTDINVQKKVASILFDYDSLIENNTRRIEILESMAELIYDEWFVKFKFPSHKSVTMIKSELGEIPEGWEVANVKQLLKRYPAGKKFTQDNVSKEGNIPVIDQSEDEYLGFHNEEPDHKANPEHPIMIFGDHTCKMKIMVKPFSVGPNTIPFISTKYSEAYIFFLIRNLVHTQEYKRHWNELMVKKVVVPKIEIVNKFASVVTPMLQEITLLQERNLNLAKTRDLLLPKLISGELDVSKLDIKVSEVSA